MSEKRYRPWFDNYSPRMQNHIQLITMHWGKIVEAFNKRYFCDDEDFFDPDALDEALRIIKEDFNPIFKEFVDHIHATQAMERNFPLGSEIPSSSRPTTS